MHWIRLSFSGPAQREHLRGHETGERAGKGIREKSGEELTREAPAGSETPPATTHRARWTRLLFALLEFLLELLESLLGPAQDVIPSVSLVLILVPHILRGLDNTAHVPKLPSLFKAENGTCVAGRYGPAGVEGHDGKKGFD